jgi:hypothetical protein
MASPIVMAQRNLRQRIAKLLDGERFLTSWQLDMIDRALDALEAGRYAEGEFIRARSVRPDLYYRPGFKKVREITVDDLLRRLGKLAAS